MKKELNIKTEQKCWSLVNNITYAEVPFWYGATYKNLKCSICMPKVRGGERYPLLVWLCGGTKAVLPKSPQSPVLAIFEKWRVAT